MTFRKEHFARSKRPVFARIIALSEEANFDYRLKLTGELLMRESMAADTIQPAKEAAARLSKRVGRFEIYDFLITVYRVYAGWMDRRVAKRSARALADEMNIVRRKGMGPIRVLIEATLPEAELKQKSRWVRALEYVYSQDISVKEFRQFVRRHGGFAGCARLAVQVERKRKRPRRDCIEGDWDD